MTERIGTDSAMEATMIRVLLSAAVLLGATVSVSAQTLRNFCSSSKSLLSRDYDLSAAASAVFPEGQFALRDDDCLYPMKVLRYGDADVLLVTSNKPGEACHGCSASMSAYVLRRDPGASHVVARFVDFGASGTFGDPGRIDGLQLGGRDAFAIESGGTFQGFTSLGVTFYVFRSGRLVQLKPNIPLSADNSGAAMDPKQAVSVEGAWKVMPSATVVVDYKVRTRLGTKRGVAAWTLKADTFVLKSGAVPLEYKAAGGG